MTAKVPTRITFGEIDFAVPRTLADILKFEKLCGEPIMEYLHPREIDAESDGKIIHGLVGDDRPYAEWCAAVDWNDVAAAWRELYFALLHGMGNAQDARPFLAFALSRGSVTKPPAS